MDYGINSTLEDYDIVLLLDYGVADAAKDYGVTS